VTVAALLLAALVAVAQPGPAGDEPTRDEALAKARRLRAELTARALDDVTGDPQEDETNGETDVRHVSLDLDVQPSPAALAGRATLTVASRRAALDRFRVRLASVFTVDAVRRDGADADWRRLDDATLEVTLAPPVPLDAEFTLEVGYHGTPPADASSGILFTSHGSTSIVATLSEPWFAYTWWPGKDDNRDKSTLELAVTVPSALSVAANGRLVETTVLSGGRTRYRFVTDYPIVPYLIAFGATNYARHAYVYERNGRTMPFELYLYPESDTAANRAAWQAALTMLDVFGDLFGTYPFMDDKYAIYQFPWSGGMEHQTATGQGGLSAFAESLTAHELAHQWWGDEVTCATWHDIWLNEGFATYSEALWREHRPGGGPADLAARMLAIAPAEPTGSVWVYDTSDPSRLFDWSLSYAKGAWVLHMLRHVVGDDTFLTALAEYRRRYAGSSATTEELRAVVEAVAGRDLEWFFASWVYGSGAPSYRIGWRPVAAAGRDWVELHVRQVQSAGVAPVFPMPLDAVLREGAADVVHVVWNDAREEHLLLPVAAPASAVTLDPDHWVLRAPIAVESFVAGPPKVVASSPAPGGRVAAGSLDAVRVTFHAPVAATAGDVELTGRRTGKVTVTAGLDGAATTLTVTPAAALPPDDYTLTVRDTVTSTESGQRLDGELSGALPSGDGVPGGDAVLAFTVAVPPRPILRHAP
jgi:aminopeptidase N